MNRMKEFLEKAQLYKRQEAVGFFERDVASALSGVFNGQTSITRYDIKTPAVNYVCKMKCQSIQTFNIVHKPDQFTEHSLPEIFHLQYVCGACGDDRRDYYLSFYIEEKEVKNGKNVEMKSVICCQKIGQYPAWSIETDKELSKLLREHEDFYKKGLICESQSYGIGAYAYFRRITEEVIDELLESISPLIEGEEKKEAYKVALQSVKTTRQTQEKIDLVKDLLPESLKPEGMNPLGVLHSALSEGLHSESDEVCMRHSEEIRTILTFLVDRVIQMKEKSDTFTESMRKILEKKKMKQ